MLLGWSLSAIPASAAEKVVLQLRWDHQFQFAGYYAALWQGYYADAGLDVEIRSAVTAQRKVLNPVKEVVEGGAHFDIGSAEILIARDRGAPIVIASAIFQQSTVAMFARKGSGLDSPAALTRLRVRRVTGDLANLEMEAVLIAEGIDPASVKPLFASRSNGRSIDLLRQGRIDAYPGYTLSTLWPARQSGIELETLRPSAYGVDFFRDSLFTSTALADRDPDLVRRFVAASLEGWRHALEHREAVADRIAQDLPRVFPIEDRRGFNRFISREVLRLTHYPVVALGHMNPDRWRRMHAVMRRAGLVKGGFDLDGLIFDPDRAAKELARALERYSVVVVVAAVLLLLAFGGWTWSLKCGVRAATKALRESEERYRWLFELSPEAVFVQFDGRVAIANPAAVEVLGARSAEQIIGLDQLEFFHPDSRQSIERRRALAASNGQALPFKEHRYARLDGEEAIVETAAAPINWHGRAAQLIVARDVTERKRIEAALHLSEERMRAVIDHSPSAIFLKNLEGCYWTANKRFTDWYGAPHDDIIGRTAHDVFPADLVPGFEQHDREVLATGGPVRRERQVTFPDGSVHQTVIAKFPVRDRAGNIIGIGAVSTDVTERERSRPNSAMPRKWKRWAASPAASRTSSTIC